MPKWIHDRADRLMEKNPEMPKSMAFGVATQQAHKAGKTPKGYGTARGRLVAKEKHSKPKKEYKKTAGLGSTLSSMKTFKPPMAKNAPFLPKGVAGTKMDPRHKFKKSREVGLETPFDQKTDGIKMQKFEPASLKTSSVALGRGLIKKGFRMSQYSGPLSEGGFPVRSWSGMPSNPRGIKVSGPPPPERKGDEEDPDTAPSPETKKASLARAAAFAIGAVAEWQKEATVTSPKAQLTSQQKKFEGIPKSKPSGPSIAQISKPKGFGKPLTGATKSL